MSTQLDRTSPEMGDARLIAYIDRLSEPLQRTLNTEEISLFRLQALGHLEMLAEELVAEGRSPSEAVELAMREYGRPDLLAIAFLDEWCKGSRPAGFARGARSATLWSFVFFGLASAICLVATQVAAMMGVGWVRDILPGLIWGAPVIAGVLTGFAVPTGNLRSVCLALAIVVIHSYLVTLLMQPYGEAREFARDQVLGWFPLGCAATYLTALLRRRPSATHRNPLIS